MKREAKSFETRLIELQAAIVSTTKLLPEYVSEVLRRHGSVPEYDPSAILISSASGLEDAAAIKATKSVLFMQTGQKSEKKLNLFPSVPVNQIFGISDQIFVDAEGEWNVSIGAVQDSLRFDTLDKLYSDEVYKENFRNNVSSYAINLEKLFAQYLILDQQQTTLQQAINNENVKEDYKNRLAILRTEYEKSLRMIEIAELMGLH